MTVSLGGVFGGLTFTLTSVVQDCILLPPKPASEFFDPGDDRLNREPGAPAVVYCRNAGDVHIYRVEEGGKGKIALIATKAEIQAVINSFPRQNTLIKQSADGTVKLYLVLRPMQLQRQLQLNATEPRPPNKLYTFVWNGC